MFGFQSQRKLQQANLSSLLDISSSLWHRRCLWDSRISHDMPVCRRWYKGRIWAHFMQLAVCINHSALVWFSHSRSPCIAASDVLLENSKFHFIAKLLSCFQTGTKASHPRCTACYCDFHQRQNYHVCKSRCCNIPAWVSNFLSHLHWILLLALSYLTKANNADYIIMTGSKSEFECLKMQITLSWLWSKSEFEYLLSSCHNILTPVGTCLLFSYWIH